MRTLILLLLISSTAAWAQANVDIHPESYDRFPADGYPALDVHVIDKNIHTWEPHVMDLTLECSADNIQRLQPNPQSPADTMNLCKFYEPDNSKYPVVVLHYGLPQIVNGKPVRQGAGYVCNNFSQELNLKELCDPKENQDARRASR